MPVRIDWRKLRSVVIMSDPCDEAEEREEMRRLAAILATTGRHIEIDPEGLLAGSDDELEEQ